jgi:hypothetical protein
MVLHLPLGEFLDAIHADAAQEGERILAFEVDLIDGRPVADVAALDMSPAFLDPLRMLKRQEQGGQLK